MSLAICRSKLIGELTNEFYDLKLGLKQPLLTLRSCPRSIYSFFAESKSDFTGKNDRNFNVESEPRSGQIHQNFRGVPGSAGIPSGMCNLAQKVIAWWWKWKLMTLLLLKIQLCPPSRWCCWAVLKLKHPCPMSMSCSDNYAFSDTPSGLLHPKASLILFDQLFYVISNMGAPAVAVIEASDRWVFCLLCWWRWQESSCHSHQHRVHAIKNVNHA